MSLFSYEIAIILFIWDYRLKEKQENKSKKSEKEILGFLVQIRNKM